MGRALPGGSLLLFAGVAGARFTLVAAAGVSGAAVAVASLLAVPAAAGFAAGAAAAAAALPAVCAPAAADAGVESIAGEGCEDENQDDVAVVHGVMGVRVDLKQWGDLQWRGVQSRQWIRDVTRRDAAGGRVESRSE